jgi:alpha-tubulin suppressor-like RCC1 family protein
MPTPTNIRALFCLLALAGCGAPSERGPESLGEARIELTNVPTAVQCVEIVAAVSGPSGVETSSTLFPVSPGASTASLAVGRLPLGSAAISGNAYALACTDTTLATTQPTWVSNTAQVNLIAGVTPKVSLTFRPNQPVNVSANFLQGVQSLTRGAYSYATVMSDGTVRQWGYTGCCNQASPASVTGLTTVAEVASGLGFACARKTAGTVWCWGYNSRGQLGPNAALNSVQMTPVQVPLPDLAKELAAGSEYACAIVGNNRVLYCWGDNSSSQFGTGSASSTPVSSPTLVYGVYSAAHVYAGVYARRTCVIRSFGNVVTCAGDNFFGEIGIGTSTPTVPSWTEVGSTEGTTAMSLGGNHTCALRADGSIKCWGYNGYGQLGNGTFTSSSSPTTTLVSDATAVTAGVHHTCAIRTNGTLACWGDLPTGAGAGSTIPTDVPGLSNVVEAAGSFSSTCAKTASVDVSCWGRNDYGELGDGTFTWHFLPAQVQLK